MENFIESASIDLFLKSLEKNKKILAFKKQIVYNAIYILHNVNYILLIMNTDNRIRIKLARIENNLTQEELAKKVGVTRQTIGLIENGRYNPTLNLCIAIAKALHKTLDELFWDL